MLIPVTPEHVARGNPCDTQGCPLALAIGDVLESLCGTRPLVAVTVCRVSIRHPDGRTGGMALDSRASARLDAYDRTGRMEPFAFTLALESIPWLNAPVTC